MPDNKHRIRSPIQSGAKEERKQDMTISAEAMSKPTGSRRNAKNIVRDTIPRNGRKEKEETADVGRGDVRI